MEIGNPTVKIALWGARTFLHIHNRQLGLAMNQLSKARVLFVASVAALAAFIGNIKEIVDFAKRFTDPDDSISIEIADAANAKKITWRHGGGGGATGEVSYMVDLYVKKKGKDKIENCLTMINIGNDAIYYPSSRERSLDRGSVAINWHYEHKVKVKEFDPDVTLQIQCGNVYSNFIKVKFE